ncbi:PadR family transcriptional regulator [Arthrobacter sp. JSM 101049]|uniref:PadR family transcriptional regulator n=1 Tax=Arthrobacter sp. JSM 101049 TaxID=929097 RepID=UPI00356A956D
MSLRYAILALLNVEPMTGYDLYKLFGESVGHVWYAPDSQIYPELRKMEKECLVEGEDIAWGRNGTKRRYHVTGAGAEAFTCWMNEPMGFSRVRDPAHLRAAYLEWATPEAARSQMQDHISHNTALLRQWEAKIREIDTGTSAMLNRRLEVTPAGDRHRTVAFKRFAYEGLIARAEAEIAWANRGLRLIEELYGSEPTTAPELSTPRR